MQPDEYWKNFNLGTELDIAGRFLFNGLQAFHEMRNFAAEEDIFEFLYGLAVGIERLLKIALILAEHDKTLDRSAFEKALITHSHQDLVKRLKEKHEIKLGSVHNAFIAVLSKFYKSHRYDRYNFASVYDAARERGELNSFLERYLKIKINIDSMLDVTRNERSHKKFVGKVVSKIVLPVFQVVESEARRQNLYTYEVGYGTKASKVFGRKSFDFEDEDILQSELIAYFVSQKASGPNSRLIRDRIEPLTFDPALEADYLAALRSDRDKQSVLDELQAHYDDMEDFKSRRDILHAASSDNLIYGADDEDEEGDLGQWP